MIIWNLRFEIKLIKLNKKDLLVIHKNLCDKTQIDDLKHKLSIQLSVKLTSMQWNYKQEMCINIKLEYK